MPCGFCGRSGIRECSELYLTIGKHKQIRAECRHAHEFKYGSSLTSTPSTASTNTPILCPIEPCNAVINGKWQRAVWKYNLPRHIQSCHPGYSWDGLEPGAPLPATLATDMVITTDEEVRLGVPVTNQRIPDNIAKTRTTKRPAHVSLEATVKAKVKRARV